MERSSHGTYRDPLDLVWLTAASRLGIRVERRDDVYASWDGRGTLSVCHERDYDRDDSLAQLILHELCHALVQGSANRRRVDWGLDNTDDEASALAEHACHHLQAALLDRYGLRALLAVTTDWRSYWDALPADPLSDTSLPAVRLARAAWSEAVRGPWSRALDDALRATAALAAVTRPLAPADSLWATTVPLTPLGRAQGPSGASCGTCAWQQAGRCSHAAEEGEPGPQVHHTWQGCFAWQARLDERACLACGACCRQGFDLVTVDEDEPIVAARPDLVTRDAEGAHLARPGGRCCALGPTDGPWVCTVYAQRPRACQDFEIAGEHCLTARRRVGATRL